MATISSIGDFPLQMNFSLFVRNFTAGDDAGLYEITSQTSTSFSHFLEDANAGGVLGYANFGYGGTGLTYSVTGGPFPIVTLTSGMISSFSYSYQTFVFESLYSVEISGFGPISLAEINTLSDEALTLRIFEDSDVINGTDYGDDILHGWGGGDTLYGLAGPDTVYGDDGNDILYGGTDSDQLFGGADNDRLNGGGGGDNMAGGDGNDLYYVDNIADVVSELGSSGVYDYVFSTVSYTSSQGIERLYLTGSGNINATGVNNQADLLSGNSGRNVLSGLSGNDLLIGGYGSDTMIGGAGTDAFRFDGALSSSANRDFIMDFNIADDTIQLENAVMTQLTATGFLNAALFKDISTGVQLQ